jgi:hypothetical protein
MWAVRQRVRMAVAGKRSSRLGREAPGGDLCLRIAVRGGAFLRSGSVLERHLLSRDKKVILWVWGWKGKVGLSSRGLVAYCTVLRHTVGFVMLRCCWLSL